MTDHTTTDGSQDEIQEIKHVLDGVYIKDGSLFRPNGALAKRVLELRELCSSLKKQLAAVPKPRNEVSLSVRKLIDSANRAERRQNRSDRLTRAACWMVQTRVGALALACAAGALVSAGALVGEALR